MTACSVELKALHPAQQEIERTAKKYNVLDAGRRFGKNEFLAGRVVGGSPQKYNGLLDGKSWGWFAPTYKILDDSWRLLVETIRPIPGVYINQSKYFAELPTGGVLECWSFEAGDDVGRSREYDGGIVVDEAAMVPRLLHIRSKSLSALTVKFQDAEEWYASTPKGMGNDFYPLYRFGQDGESDWASWMYPTAANPHIPIAFIEEKRRTMPEADFEQEYMARFLDAEAHPIGIAHIRACVGPLSEAEPVVWGVDLARAVDFTVAIGLDAGGHACRVERWRTDWGPTKTALDAMIGHHVVAYGDSTGVGDPVIEDLQRLGVRIVSCVFTSKFKQQIVEGLIAGIQQHRIHYPSGWLQTELERLTAERLSNGTRYAAPAGEHDDGVMALALAWHGYAQMGYPKAPKIDYATKEPDRARRLNVEDGELIAHPKQPKTLAELADWAESRSRQHRLPVREKERLPRRVYK